MTTKEKKDYLKRYRMIGREVEQLYLWRKTKYVHLGQK